MDRKRKKLYKRIYRGTSTTNGGILWIILFLAFGGFTLLFGICSAIWHIPIFMTLTYIFSILFIVVVVGGICYLTWITRKSPPDYTCRKCHSNNTICTDYDTVDDLYYSRTIKYYKCNECGETFWLPLN